MTEKSFSNNSEDFSFIEENCKIIKDNISEAIAKSGRTDTVRFMAVTKTVSPEKVNFAASLGINLLGENRVQEFLSKYESYDKNCEVHFIGGLQSNKVKYIIDKVAMIHSVDNIKLVDEISKRAALCNKVMDVLIEVNIGGEKTKGGVLLENLDGLVSYCTDAANIELKGFMAIPPIESGKYFGQMEEIYQKYRSKYGEKINTLSMGMSNDYQQAILYGANIVRIGSALFGKRSY